MPTANTRDTTTRLMAAAHRPEWSRQPTRHTPWAPRWFSPPITCLAWGGAKATIVGAFDDTFTYAISYTPTDGGDPVKNHKWVVQEELEGAGTDPYRTVQRRSSPLST